MTRVYAAGRPSLYTNKMVQVRIASTEVPALTFPRINLAVELEETGPSNWRTDQVHEISIVNAN